MNHHLVVEGSQQPLTERDISMLEAQTGIKLPDDYKQFLLQHNGGRPSPKRFVTRDKKVESMVAKFIPLADIPDDNLREEIEGITQARQIPANLIPIAIDPADNRVVLSVSGKDCGKVYYWSWDEEDEDHEPSYNYMRLIADSFNDFVKQMH